MGGKQIIACDDGIEVLALEQSYPGSWGRGATPSEAIKKAVSHGAKRKNGFLLYAVPPGTKVNGLGDMNWTIPEDGPIQKPLKIGTV